MNPNQGQYPGNNGAPHQVYHSQGPPLNPNISHREQQSVQIITTREIQQKLEENAMLINAINQRQNLNDLKDCLQFQQRLQENLKQLAILADQQTPPAQNPTT